MLAVAIEEVDWLRSRLETLESILIASSGDSKLFRTALSGQVLALFPPDIHRQYKGALEWRPRTKPEIPPAAAPEKVLLPSCIMRRNFKQAC